MRFLAEDGKTELTGEVWSPGPTANSVWVLLPDGTPMAVRLSTPPRQLMVLASDPQTAASERTNPAETEAYTVTLGRQLTRPYPEATPGQERDRQLRRLKARHAPPLPQKAWRTALEAS